MIFAYAWMLSGLIGYLLFYANEVYFNRQVDKMVKGFQYFAKKSTSWCPSPMAILGFIFSPIMGPSILLASLGICFSQYGMWYRGDLTKPIRDWFMTPICERK